MKHFLFVLALTMLVGAGCARSPQAKNPYTFKADATWPRTGAELIHGAVPENGPMVTATDAMTGRQFASQLPSNFTDGNGHYTTTREDELVDVQVGVGGTVADDALQFSKISGLGQFDEQELGTWHITTAFESQKNRWVARATQPDMIDSAHMYHVIECLSTPESNATFWDGCRTLIEHATVDQGTADPGSSQTR
ncbi:MAG: hypothetical protein ABIO72_01140 [Patescibacteria group bacterium]